MKDANKKSLESHFNETLENRELPFDPMAWYLMKKLLDEDDTMAPVIVLPPKSKNNSKFLTLLIMFTISILSFSTYFLFYNSEKASTLKPLELPSVTKTENSISKEKTSNNGMQSNLATDSAVAEKLFTVAATPLNSYSSQKSNASRLTTALENNNLFQSVSENKEKTANGKPGKDSVSTVVSNGETYKVFIRQRWIEDKYEYTEKEGINAINDGFIGIHFTAQRSRNSDSVKENSAGFNVQFMSGNRLPQQNIGLYGGFDFGMQFYGSGKKSNVVLNNTSLDSGFTKLRSYSMDFLGRVHLEYAKFRLIPYVNLMGGPRIYSTGQVVASYLDLKNSESRTSHNAHTSVSMMYGFGLGARLKLTNTISLDARYEWINGSKVKTVDLNQSKFNGLSYDLKMNQRAPRLEQFKVGIIFNLSSKEYDKKLVEKGHYQTYAVDSLKVDASDSNTVYLPCNCIPCDKSSNSSYQKATSTEETYEQKNSSNSNRNNSNNNNNNNSTPKKSFPGIKPPSKPTESNR